MWAFTSALHVVTRSMSGRSRWSSRRLATLTASPEPVAAVVRGGPACPTGRPGSGSWLVLTRSVYAATSPVASSATVLYFVRPCLRRPAPRAPAAPRRRRSRARCSSSPVGASVISAGVELGPAVDQLVGDGAHERAQRVAPVVGRRLGGQLVEAARRRPAAAAAAGRRPGRARSRARRANSRPGPRPRRRRRRRRTASGSRPRAGPAALAGLVLDLGQHRRRAAPAAVRRGGNRPATLAGRGCRASAPSSQPVATTSPSTRPVQPAVNFRSSGSCIAPAAPRAARSWRVARRPGRRRRRRTSRRQASKSTGS